jgi:hypothetical protein
MAGNDTLARAVTARRIALAATDTDRAQVFLEAIEQYLRAEPARLPAAEATVAQLDALGTSVQGARLEAHAQLLNYGMRAFNESYMRREAARIIALGHDVPVPQIQYHLLAMIRAYMALGEIAYVEAPESVAAVITRAKEDLGRFPPATEWPPGHAYSLIETVPFKTASLATVRNALLPFNAEQYAGHPLPPVDATYWFPNAPSTWPPGGHAASLVVYGGFLLGNCVRSDWSLLIFTLRHECLALRTLIPSWTQHYGDQLSVTLVAQTQGHAVRSVVLPPNVEADSIAWYLRQHLGLSVTVGVVVDAVQKMPPVDGRQLYRDPTFYGQQFNSNVVVLYGPGGKLVYVGQGLQTPVLRKLVARELAAPSGDHGHPAALLVPSGHGQPGLSSSSEEAQ